MCKCNQLVTDEMGYTYPWSLYVRDTHECGCYHNDPSCGYGLLPEEEDAIYDISMIKEADRIRGNGDEDAVPTLEQVLAAFRILEVVKWFKYRDMPRELQQIKSEITMRLPISIEAWGVFDQLDTFSAWVYKTYQITVL